MLIEALCAPNSGSSDCVTVILEAKNRKKWTKLAYRYFLEYYAELRELRPGNTASFEEMLQRWRASGNTVSDLTGPTFEPRTSRSRDECVTA